MPFSSGSRHGGLERGVVGFGQVRIGDAELGDGTIEGVVVARMHNAGEYIEDQPLMRIVRLDPLHVEAILPMRLFGKVKPGMKAKVVPELNEGMGHEATVVLVDAMGDAASGTFGARLELPNPDEGLPAGLKCRMQLQAEETPRLSGKAMDAPARIAAATPHSH